MTNYILRKLLQVPLILLGVVVILFGLIHLAPGDPVTAFIGAAPADPEYVQELRQSLGLDRSLPEQLAIYVMSTARGDLGYSLYYRQPVLELIAARIPATLLLTGTALAIATLGGVLLGVAAAARPNSWTYNVLSLPIFAAYSLPVFWIGQMALLTLSLQLGWFPVQGFENPRGAPDGVAALVDRMHHLILPALVLSTRYLAVNYRLTRAGMLDALWQDYVRTARSKGLDPKAVLLRHALPNALLPVVTVVGLNVGFALAGAALVEVVFGWPGIGLLTLDAVGHRDYPTILGVFVIVTTLVVVVNFLTDFAYAVLDPRILLDKR